MEHILVPIDFTTGSLQPVTRLAEAFPAKSFTIVLTHVFDMPDSITELLVLHRAIPLSTLFSDDMRAESKRLKDHYGSTIRSIVFRPVYGSTQHVFRQVLEVNNIDTVLYDEAYPYAKPHQYSIDFMKLLKKCPVQVLKAGTLRKPVPAVTKETAGYASVVI
jgi:hypothetical protein